MKDQVAARIAKLKERKIAVVERRTSVDHEEKEIDEKLDVALAFYKTLEEESPEEDFKQLVPVGVFDQTNDSENERTATETKNTEYGANIKTVSAVLPGSDALFSARTIEGKLRETEKPLTAYQIGQVLRKLADRKKISVVKAGAGRSAAIYKVANPSAHTP